MSRAQIQDPVPCGKEIELVLSCFVRFLSAISASEKSPENKQKDNNRTTKTNNKSK